MTYISRHIQAFYVFSGIQKEFIVRYSQWLDDFTVLTFRKRIFVKQHEKPNRKSKRIAVMSNQGVWWPRDRWGNPLDAPELPAQNVPPPEFARLGQENMYDLVLPSEMVNIQSY